MEPTVTTTRKAELEAVRTRRAELRGSMTHLEYALAAPAGAQAAGWGERVHAVLVELADDFAEHIDVTEGPDGLHQAILSGDLRLANAVNALAAEHPEMAAQIAVLVAATDAPVAEPDVESILDLATALLARLVRHRQRGADLIYEAFDTDIGGGD